MSVSASSLASVARFGEVSNAITPTLKPIGHPSAAAITVSAANIALNGRRIAARVGRRHHDRELVAAEPRHEIGTAHAARERLRDLLQRAVARHVSQRVVELLESVDVDDREHERLANARQLGKAACDHVFVLAPIGNAGQGIGAGLRALEREAVLEVSCGATLRASRVARRARSAA